MLRYVVLATLLAFITPGVRADEEAYDRLAHELAMVMRDSRATLPARIQAVRSLGRLGSKAKSAVPDLTHVMVRHRHPEYLPLKEAIIDALGQIGGPARPALAALSREMGRDTDIDIAVIRAMDQIMQSVEEVDLPALTRQLRIKDESIRLRAVKAIGRLGPSARPALPALTASLGDEDGDVRRAAVAALRLIQPDVPAGEAEVRAIALDLQDPDPATRMRAVKALSSLGGIAAPAIQVAINDKDADVRKAAIDALTRLLK